MSAGTDDEAAGTVQRIGATGIVAILRMAGPAEAVALGALLVDAGCDVIEVSFTTPGAAHAISDLGARRPGALVGAGTVLVADEARLAVRSGARFLLSPVFDADVDKAARDLQVPYVPGVFTAMDVWTAVRAGRRLLKPFPASLLGLAGVKALFEPFGAVRMIPTGGLGTGAVQAWRAAGALAVGLGGALTRAADPAQAARLALAAAHADVAQPWSGAAGRDEAS